MSICQEDNSKIHLYKTARLKEDHGPFVKDQYVALNFSYRESDGTPVFMARATLKSKVLHLVREPLLWSFCL